ncbi:MAG: glycosyltransferase [Pseudorhodobacter sp.]
MTRFLFYIPGQTGPSGGVGILLRWIELLNSNGFEAIAICDKPGYEYVFTKSAGRTYYSPEMDRAIRAGLRWNDRLKSVLAGFRRDRTNDITIGADDIIVIPDFAASWLRDVFPENRQILVIQAQYWLKEAAFQEVVRRNPFNAYIVTSDICYDLAQILELSPLSMVSLAVDPDLFVPAPKNKAIAYMPRRRADDVALTITALKQRNGIAGYDLVPIDGVPVDKVAGILRDSLVFMSFSQDEGFGLPPAEAMAAGCIVVGFTGGGGDEYFNPEWSFPISDGHVPSLVRKVEEILAEYENDPKRLDSMRLRASQIIRERYSYPRQQEGLLEVFGHVANGGDFPERQERLAS